MRTVRSITALLLLLVLNGLFLNFVLAQDNEIDLPEGTSLNPQGDLITEENNQKLNIHLLFSENLKNQNFLLKDSIGSVITEGKIDSTGRADTQISNDLNEITIIVNSEKILPEPNNQNGIRIGIKEIVIIFLISALLCFLPFFILGRESALRILGKLRDEIYEENLD